MSPAPADPIRRLGPFLESLGIVVARAEDGRGEVEMTVGDIHLRSLEMMHGGVTATLLDTSMGVAAHSRAPDNHYTVTIQLDIKYVKPAMPGDKLRATAQVLHAGRRTAVTRGEIRNSATNALLATGSATMMYLPLTP